jgi:hypothetical protein
VSVAVCILVHGTAAYAEVARVAVDSLLADSDFDVWVAHESEAVPRWPDHPRLHRRALGTSSRSTHRAERFLRKFQALERCLSEVSNEWILLLDADVVLARPLREHHLAAALRGRELGMVEQKGIRGSLVNRAGFLAHYTRHTLALLDPRSEPPALEDFRYFNSGVVLGPRPTWEQLVPWALQTMARQTGHHQVREHMIADQDYFQYWAHHVRPGACAELPWYWNHCEHWDDPFPRRGVLFAHFSNFCQGPASGTAARMRALRRPWQRLLDRCIPPSSW